MKPTARAPRKPLREVVSRACDIFQFMWREASPFIQRRLLLVLLLVAAAATLSGLAPIALKLLVDGLVGRKVGSAISPFLLIGLFAFSQLLAKVVGEVRTLIFAGAERRIFRSLSQRVFDHLMGLPLRFHLDRQTGAVNQTVVYGLQGYQMILNHLILTVLPVTAELGIIILILSRLAPPSLMGIFIGALLVYGLAFAHAATSVAKSAGFAVTSTIAANATITDGILNYETIKYFTAEGVVQTRVDEALTLAETEWLHFYRVYAMNGLFLAFVYASFLGLTTLYAVTALQAGRITVGDFLVVNTYLFQVLRPMEALGYATQGLSQGWGMLEKLIELLEHAPECEHSAVRAPRGPVVTDFVGTLEFQNVSASYRSDRRVLKGLSFKVQAGKTVGIVGSSGSGKSTTVRLLVRLLDPDGGRILIDGVEIRELSLVALRQIIAVVPQDTALFNETIAFNIALGNPNCSRADIENAARLAHLHDMVMRLPEKYDTCVGERGAKLSGGEKQRVSIARAVIKRPLIYVFDEATSSLDTQTEREILRSLRQISRSSTTLIIAHRLSTVVHADEIVVLEAGAVVERGTHDRLVRSEGLYAALWETQHQGPATIA